MSMAAAIIALPVEPRILSGYVAAAHHEQSTARECGSMCSILSVGDDDGHVYVSSITI
jgi:hypothetical protein